MINRTATQLSDWKRTAGSAYEHGDGFDEVARKVDDAIYTLGQKYEGGATKPTRYFMKQTRFKEKRSTQQGTKFRRARDAWIKDRHG